MFPKFENMARFTIQNALLSNSLANERSEATGISGDRKPRKGVCVNEIVLRTLRSFNLDDYRPIYHRDLDLGEPMTPRRGNLVKVVKGMRRSGKSYCLFQEMDRLISRGVDPRRICYFNFEDDRLAPVTSAVGDEVLDGFAYLNPEFQEQGVFYFFDEIQEMQGWGKWLRRVVDARKATIYVSGSSSELLSSEIATEFRGRALDFELLPYSFREVVRIEGLASVDGTGIYGESERMVLARRFDEYLERGGFPDALSLSGERAVALLQSYVQRVVSHDVVERHNLSNPQAVSSFSQRLLGMNGRQLSLRKVENDMRSAGIISNRPFLSDALRYLETAYLLFSVRELSFSLAESTNSRPKLYAIDPGLALANARAMTNDRGQRLEDAVYLELRRRQTVMRKDAICSLKTKARGLEVDFCIGDALMGIEPQLVQVCVSVEDEKTCERELRALWEAMAERALGEGTLVVVDGEEAVYEREGMRVRQVPAWRWFLEGKEGRSGTR